MLLDATFLIPLDVAIESKGNNDEGDQEVRVHPYGKPSFVSVYC